MLAIVGSFSQSPTSSQTGSPAAGGFVPIGEKAVLTANYYACSNKDDLEKIKQLMSDKDRLAASRYSDQKGCAVLTKGVVGSVEDLSVWTANTCIRTPGNPECVWFPTELVAKAP